MGPDERDRQQAADALARLRRQQRDGTALKLAQAMARVQADEHALEQCEQQRRALEAGHLARLAAGHTLDPAWLALSRHALEASDLRHQRAEGNVRESRRHSESVRRQLQHDESARRVAEHWQQDLAGHAAASRRAADHAASLEAQLARTRSPSTGAEGDRQEPTP